MNRLFKNKYRIKSIRLENWDYSSKGAYFITICIKNRECCLGDVVNGKIILSEIGRIVEKFWCQIPNHFNCVDLDLFVVMPNHVHGILIINANFMNIRRDAINRVSTVNEINRQMGGITGVQNPMNKKSLSTIVRWYKGRCKFEMNKIDKSFQWQPRFYERIIRNENELNRIREYIVNNPIKWSLDRNNSKRCFNSGDKL